MKPEITKLPANFHPWLDNALADDIWQAHCNNNEPALEAAVAKLIDAAIAAETERCSRIVKSFLIIVGEPGYQAARYATLAEIESAIRARVKP